MKLTQVGDTKFYFGDVTKMFTDDSKEQNSAAMDIHKNWWWACIDGDPTKALFYKTSNYNEYYSPQCNSNEAIIKSSVTSMYPDGWQPVQVPIAFIPRKFHGS